MNKYEKDLVEDYKQTIARLQKECEEKTDLNVLLTKQALQLEQYKLSKQRSYEHYQKKCNDLELENRELKSKLKNILEENNFLKSWRRKPITCQECYDEGVEVGRHEVLFQGKWIEV